MIDFENAKKIAFEHIKRIESVRELSENEKQKEGLPFPFTIWHIDTEISSDDKAQPIKFLLILLPDFPLSLPKITLTSESYEKFKFLPHIQTDRFVCTFPDEAQPNPLQPDHVVEQVVRRAKRIVQDGLAKANEVDFADEFSSYWGGVFSKKDGVLTNVILVVEGKLNSTFNLLILAELYAGFRFVIHQGDPSAMRFKAHLDAIKAKYSEQTGIYIGDLSFEKPPFEMSNRESLEILMSNLSPKDLQKFINHGPFPKLVVFSKSLGGRLMYFGWLYKAPKLDRNGFRRGFISPLSAISTFESSNSVTRFLVEEFSIKRQMARTSGVRLAIPTAKLCIVGIGSIGSNLITFLSSIQNVELTLIDSDTLKIENIGRHLLGFNYIGLPKVKGVQSFLQQRNPLQRVDAIDESIVQTLLKDVRFLNKFSYVFVAIGRANTENWLASLVEEGKITVPIFFLWVEPYLAGGHCLFLHPEQPRFRRYFDEAGNFKFNVIAQKEYSSNNPKLSLKEVGCSTSFVPYSGANTLMFLGNLFIYINEIIRLGKKETLCFSWVGDLDLVRSTGIEINSEYTGRSFGEIATKIL